MASGALFIGWGPAVRGRELKALEVFNEVLAFYTKLQQAGEITSFEPVALEPHGGDLAGFMIVKGDPAKLQRLRTSAEFISLNNRGSMVVDHLGVVTAFVDDGLQSLFADFGAQAARLGG